MQRRRSLSFPISSSTRPRRRRSPQSPPRHLARGVSRENKMKKKRRESQGREGYSPRNLVRRVSEESEIGLEIGGKIVRG